MTISQLSYPVLSKSFTLLFFAVVLFACNAGENFPAPEAVASAAGNNTRDTVADPDFDGDLIVNAEDIAYLKAMRFTADPDADLNGNGIVSAQDLVMLKAMFFRPPAPVPVASLSESPSTIDQGQSATLSRVAESYQ